MTNRSMTYGEQLKHPNWQRKRLEILGRDEFRCQVCMETEETLHVHHKHYVKGRLAWEYEGSELTTLCERCHTAAHEEQVRLRTLIAKLRPDGPQSTPEAAALLAGWSNQYLDGEFADLIDGNPRTAAAGFVAYRLLEDIWLTKDELFSLFLCLGSEAFVDDLRALIHAKMSAGGAK